MDKMTRMLSLGKSQKVRASKDRINIKTIVSNWFNSLRPTQNLPAVDALLGPIDKSYNELLEFCERSTSRIKYRSHLKTLKTELVRFRSQVNILMASGQMPFYEKPDFSKLVSDQGLLSIIERRWDETVNCIESRAPLAATVMIGALLEALLLSRIEREKYKDSIFNLNSTPMDTKTGKAKKLQLWTLADYIDVCYEMEWIRKPLKDIGVILRDYRNLIHPREELRQKIHLNSDDAKMYWAIFSKMADQIVNSV